MNSIKWFHPQKSSCITNMVDISTKPIQLCSPFFPLSNASIYIPLLPLLAQLTQLNKLSLLTTVLWKYLQHLQCRTSFALGRSHLTKYKQQYNQPYLIQEINDVIKEEPLMDYKPRTPGSHRVMEGRGPQWGIMMALTRLK